MESRLRFRLCSHYTNRTAFPDDTKKLSSILRKPIRYVSRHLRDRRGAALQKSRFETDA